MREWYPLRLNLRGRRIIVADRNRDRDRDRDTWRRTAEEARAQGRVSRH